MAVEATPTEPASREQAPERRWAPRIWIGCDFFGWMRLLARNRFAIGWQFIYIAIVDTIASLMNTLLRGVQSIFYGRQVKRFKIEHPPIFILGHWRSGTTLLHELLILDPRHGFPTTLQCFAPNHFLLTEGIIKKWFGFIMPNRRPMDNMAAGWDRPQEDEFALCNMGVPSPYLTIAFPNRPPQQQEYFDLEKVPPEDREAWKQRFLHFLKLVSYRDPKRIVLKSPPHTCRVKILLEMFPDACFVNIVRDPYVLFASTVNLWKSLYDSHGLQRPTHAGLEEYVLSTFSMMHETLEATRGLCDPARFYDLKYEDLVQDPMSEIRMLYEHLGLGEFEQALPGLSAYVAEMADYKRNRYELAPRWRDEVAARWRPYFERYGYSLDATSI